MVCLIFKGGLINNWESIPQTRPTTSENTDFLANFRVFFFDFSLIFPVFSLSFFSFFHRSVTLVTAKKQHCGWNARAYACTRETLTENSPSTIFLIFPSSSFLLSWFLLFSFLTSLSSFFLLLSPSFFFFLASFAPSRFPLLLFWGAWFNTLKYHICYFCIAVSVLFKEENAVFRDFFTLWGNIFPYTNRGMRCKPPSIQELMTCIEH